jgi:hypothetical protein
MPSFGVGIKADSAGAMKFGEQIIEDFWLGEQPVKNFRFREFEGLGFIGPMTESGGHDGSFVEGFGISKSFLH